MEIATAGEMVTDIIEMQQPFAVQKIEFDTEKSIKLVEETFKDFPTDMTVPENYVFVKNGVKKVKKLITATEARRKELKKDALAYGKKVDSTAKEIASRFIAVKTPMVEVVTAHETKEEIKKREIERIERERQENIEAKINGISGLVAGLMLSDAAEIKQQIETLTADDVAWADEHKEKVVELKRKTLAQLDELLNMKTQAEAASIAAAKAEAERIQREEEEQKKRDAEQKAIRIENARLHAENERLEKERLAAAKIIQDQKDAVAAAEQEKIRVAAEKKRKEEEALALAEKRRLVAVETEKLRVEQEKAAIEKKKEDAENREAAVALTMEQFVVNDIGGDTDGLYPILIRAIQADKFKHIKWVD